MIRMMNSPELKFFDVLDKELEKVEAFYEEREAEAIERCKALRDQLQQLAEHREEYLARHAGPSRIIRPLLDQTPIGIRKRIPVSNANPVAEARENGDDPASLEARQSASKRNSVHLHLNPETYVNARRKLKLATFETCAFRLTQPLWNCTDRHPI
jgi:hypothetical protein